MPVLLRGYGQIQGNQITKAAQGLPATTTATLFTVAGGTVLIEWLVGFVTTAIQNQACNLSLGNTPTGGSAASTSLATATAITNKPVGSLFIPAFSSGVGTAAIVAQAVQDQAGSAQSFIVPAGTITWTTSATNSGQIAWYLNGLPVDSGATVS
jgi:hypothetical protein